MTRKEIEELGQRALKETEAAVRNFLKRKVGRQLIAIILGKPDKPNFLKADSYLYKGVKLNEWEMLKIHDCYLSARVVDQLRYYEKGIDKQVARNWLMSPCSHLEDHAPICAIRDGRSYGHLCALGAAKTFVLWKK